MQWKIPDVGQRNCPKHVEFYSENKFEKLLHRIGLIIRIYHDARSSERRKETWRLHCRLGIAHYLKIRLSECISALDMVFQHAHINIKAVWLRHSYYVKAYGLGTGNSFVLFSFIQATAFQKFCIEPKFSIHIQLWMISAANTIGIVCFHTDRLWRIQGFSLCSFTLRYVAGLHSYTVHIGSVKSFICPTNTHKLL